jgi:DivIVA domain-containing protein
MIDESFHLTPLDVRRTEFPAALRGYDKARVDEFRDRVANELERLTRINQELESKAKGFHEQLRAFRERDKALNDALVSAQQLRAEVGEQAEREAQLVLREAIRRASRCVASPARSKDSSGLGGPILRSFARWWPDSSQSWMPSRTSPRPGLALVPVRPDSPRRLVRHQLPDRRADQSPSLRCRRPLRRPQVHLRATARKRCVHLRPRPRG